MSWLIAAYACVAIAVLLYLARLVKLRRELSRQLAHRPRIQSISDGRA